MTGIELRQRREKLQLSQEHIAYLAGLTGKHRRVSVYQWEMGRYPVSETTAALLDIKLGRLEAMEPVALDEERQIIAQATRHPRRAVRPRRETVIAS